MSLPNSAADRKALLEIAQSISQTLTPEEKEALSALWDAQKPLWTPFPGPQTAAMNSQADELFLGGAAGGGKMLEVATPIPTPDGWRRMDALRQGDEVFDERGTICHVTIAHPVAIPDSAYLLTFDDDSQVCACGDHRWLTYSASDLMALTRLDPVWRARRRARRPARVSGKKSEKFSLSLAQRNSARPYVLKEAPRGSLRTTREISETLYVRGRKNHAIPVSVSLDLPEADLPFDPYLLGLWLGDGHTGDNAITTMDPEILEAFTSQGYPVLSARSNGSKATTYRLGRLRFFLNALGLLGNKHIPAIYLRSSRAQRLALLQGLMDTDGTAGKGGSPEFDNTNHGLIQGALELIASLGWKARAVEGRAICNGVDHGATWNIKWKASDWVFRLPRKLSRQRLAVRRTTRFRYVVACDPVPPREMRCISVDSPSRLYLAGMAMIPTHNSDAILGMAITRHHTSVIFRREYPQTRALIRRSRQIIGDLGTYNSQLFEWRFPDGRVIEFGACQYEHDVERWMGRPHDGIFFDELSQFSRDQYLFLIGWNRPADGTPRRCRVIATGNPPTSPEGRWVVEEWSPWLEKGHPDPAEPGELRWYIRDKDNKIIWRKHPFEATLEDRTKVRAKSRTFIPARVDDNPVLLKHGYKAILASMQEPFRSQLLYGDFSAGMQDDAFQVVPTAWVLAAQGRWSEDGGDNNPLTVLGADLARGGKDQTVLALRHGTWLAPLLKYPGSYTPDGPSAAALIRSRLESGVPVHLDGIGIGAAVYDLLRQGGGIYRSVIFSHKTDRRDRSGTIRFRNLRTFAYWHMREILDPHTGLGIALPPDPQLLADLASARWKDTPSGIQIESKEDIKERIGRSPDAADATVLAFLDDWGIEIPPQEKVKSRPLFDDTRPSSAIRRGFLGRKG